ncbi:hypothetical protein RGUI_2849 [Rhodovulum sp. P5]|nr:hypothetical protein RGUI_2849 [Rhodovulum sp. P5]
MTRAEAVALSEEKRLVEQGYAFLDEKRVILAGEIMARLADWQALQLRLDAAREVARDALGAQIRHLGLETLQLWPAPGPVRGPQLRPVRFLGARLLAAGPERPDTVAPSPQDPHGRALAEAFGALHGVLAEMALLSANLYRLADEYRRTERRAKALENVLIPEIVADLKRIEAQLEANDQEDAIRVRVAARHRA